MAHQPRNSIKPPRIVFISLIFVLIIFAAVWASVTAAVKYGEKDCPNRVGGTGATGCR